MGSLKLPHASGNSMSIAAPATNPASDLELKLPATIGSAGQVLTNSSTAGTLEFADFAIIQATRSVSTGEFSTTSGTYQNAHTATITPKLSTSKFLINYMPVRMYISASCDGRVKWNDGSNDSESVLRCVAASEAGGYNNPCLQFWHNSSLTAGSAATFTCKFRNASGGSHNIMLGDNGEQTVIIIMEVAL